MSTFTAQQKKDLEPLARRVAQMNEALDAVDEKCTCADLFVDPDGPECRVYPSPRCLTLTVTSCRIQMNLNRLANAHLSDADLVKAIRALANVFAGMPTATSHATFANDILTSLRGKAAFDEGGRRR